MPRPKKQIAAARKRAKLALIARNGGVDPSVTIVSSKDAEVNRTKRKRNQQPNKTNNNASEHHVSNPNRRRSKCNQKSPNIKTRAFCKATGVDPFLSGVEKERIDKIKKEFKLAKRKPCSIYGLDREEQYSGFFFCSNCRKADSMETTNTSHVIDRRSDTYKCLAFHTSLDHPTEKKKFVSNRRKYTSRGTAANKNPDHPPANAPEVKISDILRYGKVQVADDGQLGVTPTTDHSDLHCAKDDTKNNEETHRPESGETSMNKEALSESSASSTDNGNGTMKNIEPENVEENCDIDENTNNNETVSHDSDKEGRSNECPSNTNNGTQSEQQMDECSQKEGTSRVTQDKIIQESVGQQNNTVLSSGQRAPCVENHSSRNNNPTWISNSIFNSSQQDRCLQEIVRLREELQRKDAEIAELRRDLDGLQGEYDELNVRHENLKAEKTKADRSLSVYRNREEHLLEEERRSVSQARTSEEYWQ